MIEGRTERTPAAPGWGVAKTLLLWFGVLGPPAAWTILLVFGYGFEEVACSRGSSGWGFGAGTAELALFVAALAVAVGALASAFWLRRDVERRPGLDVRGRLAFMARAGMLVSVLFGALILFTGFGVASGKLCVR